MTKQYKNAGKGMTPKKGYNYSKYAENYSLINWKKDGNKDIKIFVKIDENTKGEL